MSSKPIALELLLGKVSITENMEQRTMEVWAATEKIPMNIYHLSASRRVSFVPLCREPSHPHPSFTPPSVHPSGPVNLSTKESLNCVCQKRNGH
jgi:hypothetical protein